VLAPTGTISFMMDCDTTGIEPDIALVKYKQLAGGGMLKIVNQTVPLALETLNYDDEQIKVDHRLHRRGRHDRGRPDPEAEHLAVFDCAFKPAGTRRFRGRPTCDDGGRAAVPFRGDLEDGQHAARHHARGYRRGLHWGLEAGAQGAGHLPRRLEGSQPLNTKKEEKKEKRRSSPAAARTAARHPESITHKFNVAGHEGYITVGLYPDGRPGEMFITMAKEGSTIGGLMDCFGTAVSMSLQYGVPLEVLVNKFSHTRFEPMGHTKNPDIRIAKSVSTTSSAGFDLPADKKPVLAQNTRC
jgi:ribonucleoside-diphosphate reductase alpha chain